MSSTPQWRPAGGVVCRVAVLWCRIGASGAVAGLPKCAGPPRRRRILVHGLGQQARRRRPRLA